MLEPHEHLHLYADGLRRFVHVHEPGIPPTRPHRHVNGAHSHPHGHAQYEPLPPDQERRPIVPVVE